MWLPRQEDAFRAGSCLPLLRPGTRQRHKLRTYRSQNRCRAIQRSGLDRVEAPAFTPGELSRDTDFAPQASAARVLGLGQCPGRCWGCWSLKFPSCAYLPGMRRIVALKRAVNTSTEHEARLDTAILTRALLRLLRLPLRRPCQHAEIRQVRTTSQSAGECAILSERR